MILKVTFFKQIKMLSYLMLCCFIYLFFIWSVLDFDSIRELCYALGPLLLLYVLPTLYIHYNYYIYSKHFIFEFNEGGVLVKNQSKERIYTKFEVKQIVLFMTAVKANDNVLRNFPFEDYYYAKIILKNGEEIVVTCLFSGQIDVILTQIFDDVEITKERKFYPIIKSNTLKW